MYAVVTTGGKQVKMAQGDVVRVEKIEAPVGDTVELTTVNLVAKEDGIIADPKLLATVKVVCEVTGQGRRKKIRVFKYKKRKDYRRTAGHRQSYTELKVKDIVA